MADAVPGRADDGTTGAKHRRAEDGEAADAAAPEAALPRVLLDTSALTARVGAADERGALWRLAEPTRHLDANVIALPPGGTIDLHTGSDEDVLWHVLAGAGTLTTDGGDVPLAPGSIVWLPRRSRRAVTAGEQGLRYFSVHRRKSGLQIGSRPD